MKTNSTFSATLALALCCAMVLVTCSPLFAQVPEYGDPHPDVTGQKTSGIAASSALRGGYTAASHSGASPFPTPTPTDTQFVRDTAAGLDTGCQFRSQGSLKFTLEVTRVVGATDGEGKLSNPQQLIDNGVVNPWATLTMPAYDVDFNAPTSAPDQPERDRVLFNGEPVGNLGAEGYLQGENNRWRMNTIRIPISRVKFARENGLSPIPGQNQIEILIDQANIANNKELWCTAVDWAALKFRALAPVVMIHGNGESGAFWDRLNFTKPFHDDGVLYDNSISLPTTFIAINSALLLPYLTTVQIKYGVNHIHIVCHSKGGLDTRGWLKLIPTQNAELAVLSMTTLSTPHKGSALADYLRDSQGASIWRSERPERVYAAQKKGGRYDEGRQNLTTQFVAEFNQQNLPLPTSFVVHGEKTDVQYFSIGADANADDSTIAGIPTITADELAGTSQTANQIFQFMGGTLVYNILYNVASTRWEWRYVSGGRVRVVRESPNLDPPTDRLNDMLVTVGSSKLSQFAPQTFPPELKRNHATVANEGVGRMVLSIIRSAQPVGGP